MILNEVQIEELQGIITNCTAVLYENDSDIIRRGGMEQSASFRFAVYLNDFIRGCNWLNNTQVDIEYNKNGLEPKKTPRRPNGVRPDIIVHNRGNNDRNVLVIEIKGWWNDERREADIIKLEDFVDQDGEYKYGLGAFVELGEHDSYIQYFKDY